MPPLRKKKKAIKKIKKPTSLEPQFIEGVLKIQVMSHDDNLVLITFSPEKSVINKMFTMSLSKDELELFKRCVDAKETANCERCHAFVGYSSLNNKLIEIAEQIGIKKIEKKKKKVRRRRLSK